MWQKDWDAVKKNAPRAKCFADKNHRIDNANKRMSAAGARIAADELWERLKGTPDFEYLQGKKWRRKDSEQFVAKSSIRDGHDNTNGVESYNKKLLTDRVRFSNPAHALRLEVWNYSNTLAKLSKMVTTPKYNDQVENGLPTRWFKRNVEKPCNLESVSMHVVVHDSRTTGIVRDTAMANRNYTVKHLTEHDSDFDAALLNFTCTCGDGVLNSRVIPCAHMYAFCSKAGIDINENLHEMHRAEYAQAQRKALPGLVDDDPQPRKRHDGTLKLPTEAQNCRGRPKKKQAKRRCS